MRNVILIFVAIVAFAALINCDDETDPSVCDQAAVIMDVAKVASCGGRVDCVPCDCWDAGLSLDGTECGEALTCDATAAADCVADETLCASNIETMVQTLCGTDF